MDETETRRIAVCVECQLPLPLLRPVERSDGETWVCSFCGCHYHAVLDREQSALHANVRRPGEA